MGKFGDAPAYPLLRYDFRSRFLGRFGFFPRKLFGYARFRLCRLLMAERRPNAGGVSSPGRPHSHACPAFAMRTHCFGGKNIIEAHVPGWEEWVPRLLGELEASRSRIETSHRIGGRWENSYLPIELVPSVRSPMRFARDLGKGELNLSR